MAGKVKSGLPPDIYNPWAKNDFYSFKWLREIKRIFVMWKLHEIPISVSIMKFYWDTAMYMGVYLWSMVVSEPRGWDWVIVTETVASAETKRFTIWPFPGKAGQHENRTDTQCSKCPEREVGCCWRPRFWVFTDAHQGRKWRCWETVVEADVAFRRVWRDTPTTPYQGRIFAYTDT